jgi:predicted ArsR family transcriptional regulator
VDHGQEDFAAQVAGVAALAEPVRRDLYLFVAAQPAPVSRDDAAGQLGLPRHTVKFHLDRLVEQGLLEVEFRRLSGRQGPGAGRPTKLYRRAERETSVALPPRQYDVAGELMAEAIEESTRRGGSVIDALGRAAAERGEQLGRDVRATTGGSATSDELLDAVLTTMTASGYEPRVVEGAVTLANCPFHRLAEEHTELVCGMNLALVGALTAELGDLELTASLEPAPDRCCVVLRPRAAQTPAANR